MTRWRSERGYCGHGLQVYQCLRDELCPPLKPVEGHQTALNSRPIQRPHMHIHIAAKPIRNQRVRQTHGAAAEHPRQTQIVEKRTHML